MECLKNYRKLADVVKKIALERCQNARVIIFGSVVEGKATALSDIDILVICDLNIEDRVKLKAEIRKKLGYDAPIELHIISKEEYENWYKRFLRKFEEVERLILLLLDALEYCERIIVDEELMRSVEEKFKEIKRRYGLIKLGHGGLMGDCVEMLKSWWA